MREVRGSYLGVDERDADPVVVEQHAALSPVLVQLLVEKQEEDVSGGAEGGMGKNRGAQNELGLEAHFTIRGLMQGCP